MKKIKEMKERSILLVSIGVAVGFSVFGVSFGIISKSSMITFDGIYSLLSVGLSYLSLVTLQQVESIKEDRRFPFGKAHFEPILILFKSVALIGMCLVSAANALSDIYSGGREVSTTPAIVYATISTIGTLIITQLIAINNADGKSALLKAERNEWLGDAMLSFLVLVGFIVIVLLDGTNYARFVPYIDPAMVLLASSFFIFIPLRSLIASGREMLYLGVDEDLQAPVDLIAKSVAKKYNAEYKLRMTLSGREVSIELNFLVPPSVSLSVEDMDELRRDLYVTASQLTERCWLNIGYTSKGSWL